MEIAETDFDALTIIHEGYDGFVPCVGDILIADPQFSRRILYGGVKDVARDDTGKIVKVTTYSNGVQFVALRGGRVSNAIGVRISFTYGLNARNCHRKDGESDQPQFDGAGACRVFNDTHIPKEGADAVANTAFTGAYKVVRVNDFVHLGTKDKAPKEYKVSVPTLQKLEQIEFEQLCKELQPVKSILLTAFFQKEKADLEKFGL